MLLSHLEKRKKEKKKEKKKKKKGLPKRFEAPSKLFKPLIEN